MSTHEEHTQAGAQEPPDELTIDVLSDPNALTFAKAMLPTHEETSSAASPTSGAFSSPRPEGRS